MTLGEVMALFLAEPGPVLGRGERFSLSYAGAEATVAVGAVRLGLPATYMGRVGADPLGDGIRRALRGEGVETAGLRTDPDRPTGVLVRDAPAVGPVTVLYHRAGSAGSALAEEDLDLDLIRSARVLHVTAITAMVSRSARAALSAAVAAARGAGVTVSFDPNVRRRLGSAKEWCTTVDHLARQADIVLTGDEDLRSMGVDAEPVRWFSQRGAATVVVKRGGEGAEEVGPDGRHEVPAPPVALVDPVGAGDAFAAGWLSAWASGAGPVDRLARGAAAGAAVVATAGDVPGLPDRAAAESMATQLRGAVHR